MTVAEKEMLQTLFYRATVVQIERKYGKDYSFVCTIILATVIRMKNLLYFIFRRLASPSCDVF